MQPRLAYVQPKYLDDQAVEDNIILLDVRRAEDFAREHIAESINIPLEHLRSKLSILPVNKKLVLVCRDGHIARKAAYQAMELGREVYVLDGGLLTFQSKNFHVKKSCSQQEQQFKFILACGAATSIGMVATGIAFLPVVLGGAISIIGASIAGSINRTADKKSR